MLSALTVNPVSIRNDYTVLTYQQSDTPYE